MSWISILERRLATAFGGSKGDSDGCKFGLKWRGEMRFVENETECANKRWP